MNDVMTGLSECLKERKILELSSDEINEVSGAFSWYNAALDAAGGFAGGMLEGPEAAVPLAIIGGIVGGFSH